jgi:hypothetical protein
MRSRELLFRPDPRNYKGAKMNTIRQRMKNLLSKKRTKVILAFAAVFGVLLAFRPAHHQPAPIVDGRPKPIARRKVRVHRPATSTPRADRASHVVHSNGASPCGAGSLSEQQTPRTSPAPLPSDERRRNTVPTVPSFTSEQGRVITSISAIPPNTYATGRAILRPISARMTSAFGLITTNSN